MKNHLATAALLALAGSAQAGIGLLNGVFQDANGTAAHAYSFGSLSAAPKVLFVGLARTATGSFEEYANFTVDALSDVSGSANSYALNFMGIDVLGIDGLTIQLWDNNHPGGSTLFSTFAGNNLTNSIGTLSAGQYHLDISGVFGRNAMGGQYSVALNAVPAVPEPQTYALMLAGLGVVGFVARRRRQAQ